MENKQKIIIKFDSEKELLLSTNVERLFDDLNGGMDEGVYFMNLEPNLDYKIIIDQNYIRSSKVQTRKNRKEIIKKHSITRASFIALCQD